MTRIEAGKVAAFILTMCGFIWATTGLMTTLSDVGLGIVLGSLGIIGWGLLDYIEERS